MSIKPPATPPPLDVFQSQTCAERLKALSEPLRLRIVDLLRSGECTVSEIAVQLETEIVTVSHHLQILKRADIVTPRRDGRFVCYGLSKDVLQNRGESRFLLDLGCCAIEVPLTVAEA
ncbi:MAG: winged helix-turn-helix transcriptional regulator [Planctomycetaceae bacterium]|nr:winged helix-turn-helix transcriptional regulator [Planctomycetaceae bacterium]